MMLQLLNHKKILQMFDNQKKIIFIRLNNTPYD